MTTIEQARAVEHRLREHKNWEARNHEAANTIADLVSELEAAQRDAARYQWLAVNAYVGIAPHPKPHEVWCLRLPNPSDCNNLDTAIDAAIAAGGTK
jgi:hypothetical protein